MTTYLLITSNKPTELTASTDGKNWLPVLNASIRDSVHGLIECKILFGLDGHIEIKLDTTVELEGWEPEIQFQIEDKNVTGGWLPVSERIWINSTHTKRQAYRLKRSEPVKELPEECQDPIASIGGCVFGGSSKNYCKKCVNESPIEVKTQDRHDLIRSVADKLWNKWWDSEYRMTKDLFTLAIQDEELRKIHATESHKTQEIQDWDVVIEKFNVSRTPVPKCDGTYD